MSKLRIPWTNKEYQAYLVGLAAAVCLLVASTGFCSAIIQYMFTTKAPYWAILSTYSAALATVIFLVTGRVIRDIKLEFITRIKMFGEVLPHVDSKYVESYRCLSCGVWIPKDSPEVDANMFHRVPGCNRKVRSLPRGHDDKMVRVRVREYLNREVDMQQEVSLRSWVKKAWRFFIGA